MFLIFNLVKYYFIKFVQKEVNSQLKKNIFLSFRPEFFRPILYGMKKYEYRKRFCKEPTIAYLYLSSPVQEVVGIIEFLEPMISEELLNDYNNQSCVYERIQRSITNGEHYIIPIKSLRLFEKPISIKKLKEINPNFFIPQCYCNLDNQKNIFEYLKNQKLLDKEFDNDHSKIFEENLCVLCNEMEEMEEYKEKDIIFRRNPRYSRIKCSSLLKG